MGFFSRMLGQEDVVIGVGVKGGIEVDDVDGGGGFLIGVGLAVTGGVWMGRAVGGWRHREVGWRRLQSLMSKR